tara:strand:+ start:9832 stop:10212 length:381 start_codon:yes stop_codon:yes gene_type:complete
MRSITIPLQSINTSLQVGDTIYYVSTHQVWDGSNTSYTSTWQDTDPIKKLGIVVAISEGSIRVIYDDSIIRQSEVPGPNSFIMFEKNKLVNSSSLKGYYAEVNFVNYSQEKIELFSIGSEISESSK